MHNYANHIIGPTQGAIATRSAANIIRLASMVYDKTPNRWAGSGDFEGYVMGGTGFEPVTSGM